MPTKEIETKKQLSKMIENNSNGETMETKRLFCYIPVATHRKTKAIAAMNGIDIKDFVNSALLHYIEHMENEDLNIDESLIKE